MGITRRACTFACRGLSAALLLGALAGVRPGTTVARAEPLPCREDERLAEAAASILLRGEPIRPSGLVEAVRREGYDGVAVRAKESEDEVALRTWLAGLAAEASGVLECGESRSEERRLIIAARRLGRLVRDGTRLRGELGPGLGDARLAVELADGELLTVPVSRAQLKAGVSLPEGAVPKRVQLVADAGSGPRTVAELAFEPLTPQAPPAPQSANGGPSLLSRAALTSRFQSFRRSLALGTLRENRLLVASADAHAARICELGKIAHRLEGEDPEDRLRREHVIARGVGEALARAESSERAFQALVESPSHRLALTRRDFTDVGVGQASDRKGQVCVVVLLASWPRRAP